MTASISDSQGEDLRLEKAVGPERAEAWLWWNEVPELPGEKLGSIGHFSTDGPQATATLLAEAEHVLSSQGCTLAVGPMDGNTWRKYRFVTDAGDLPPFFLEPMNPSPWPDWWKAAGYDILASYHSTVNEDLTRTDPRVTEAAQRLRASGITLRPISRERFVDDLIRIHDLSLVSFTKNYLYTPLPREAFLAQYVPLKERIVPEMVLLAERGGELVGYAFATPDYAQAVRSVPVDTVVVKTLAVRPGRACAGLGAWLLAEIQSTAATLGFKRSIHALMHESNNSGNLSSHYARVMRRYALLSKRLSP